MNSGFINNIEPFGLSRDEILFFSEKSASLSNYLSLIDASNDLPRLTGVVEVSCHPFLYLIDQKNLSENPLERFEQVRRLVNVLACRGGKSYLAIVALGVIEIHIVQPQEAPRDGIEIFSNDAKNAGFLRDLIEGTVPLSLGQRLNNSQHENSSVENILFNLLTRVSRELNSTNALKGDHETILALCGRALLTRFLIDRKILTAETFPDLFEACTAENCFGSAKNAALTNAWLDKTFNGDLLKLPIPSADYARWFNTLDNKVFQKLSFILGHANAAGQLPLPGFIDFAHVPVGLLSEVYERYAHESLDGFVRASAKRESIHYTPRRLAAFMLEEAFDGVTTNQPHEAKILDPSCGAGVFVVLAFRRLIAEHWQATGVRPDTKKIREILYTQVKGFDINQSALTLAALGLYLSALELDPEPLPTSKLKFPHNLIGTVLLNTRKQDEPWQKNAVVMGSLGDAVPENQLGRYDIVIGNPPWSSFPAELNDNLSYCIRDVARKREPNAFADIAATHQNPDQVPDLPFVWKSMEWSKQQGVIAFALHARMLFKNSEKSVVARNHLFRAVNVTGVINASALRNSQVWPRVTAQFCLFFAINEIPKPNNYFNFISPKYERALNDDQGRMRIDFQSRDPVQAIALERRPYLLNVLFKGTPLDVAVVEYIQGLVYCGRAKLLGQYWNSVVGKHRSGVGFQVSSDKQDASALIRMSARMLSKESEADYIIQTKNLPVFDRPRLHRVRKLTIYQPPLVLMNKAIGANSETITARVALGKVPIAYNESFYGYSAYGHPEAQALAKYIFAIMNSELMLYYTLMISSQYGIEREVIHKADIDSFPLIPYESLTEKMKDNIDYCFDMFKETRDVRVLNKLVYSIYGIDKYSAAVISDTLSVALPIAESRNKAEADVSEKELQTFCKELQKTMLPFAIDVQVQPKHLRSWRFIEITKAGAKIAEVSNNNIFSAIADNAGCSMIKINSKNTLILGLLNQYRYWTPTRARLVAMQILKEGSFFRD